MILSKEDEKIINDYCFYDEKVYEYIIDNTSKRGDILYRKLVFSFEGVNRRIIKFFKTFNNTSYEIIDLFLFKINNLCNSFYKYTDIKINKIKMFNEFYYDIYNKTKRIYGNIVLKYFFIQNLDKYTNNLIYMDIFRYIKEPSNDIILKFVYNCDNIIGLYKLIDEPSEYITLKCINKCDNIVGLYKLIKNPSEDIKIRCVYNCDNILELYKLIEEPSEDIKIRCVYKCNNIIELYKLINEPPEYITLKCVENCNNIVELYKLIEEPTEYITLKCVENCNNIVELYKLIVKPTDNIIIKCVNKCNTINGKIYILICYDISETVYINYYNLLKCDYLIHVNDPTEDFFIQIVKKSWYNLKYIDDKYKTKRVYKIAKKQNRLAWLYK